MYCLAVLEAESPSSEHQQGWFFLGAVREDLFQAFGSTAGGLLIIVDILWLARAPPQCHMAFSLCVCVHPHFLFLSGHQLCGLRTDLPSSSVTSSKLNEFYMQPSYFHRRPHSELLGVSTSACDLLGNTIRPLTGLKKAS